MYNNWRGGCNKRWPLRSSQARYEEYNLDDSDWSSSWSGWIQVVIDYRVLFVWIFYLCNCLQITRAPWYAWEWINNTEQYNSMSCLKTCWCEHWTVSPAFWKFSPHSNFTTVIQPLVPSLLCIFYLKAMLLIDTSHQVSCLYCLWWWCDSHASEMCSPLFKVHKHVRTYVQAYVSWVT